MQILHIFYFQNFSTKQVESIIINIEDVPWISYDHLNVIYAILLFCFWTVLDNFRTIYDRTLPTTAATGQNNTSSTVEDEGPTIISFKFQPDGTCWLTLNASGRLSAVITFNHTLTPANGYIVDYTVPYYANNGTQVDLNDVDFSSQVTFDPNANVRLPAKPKILLQYPTGAPASLPSSSTPPPTSTQTVPETIIPATPYLPPFLYSGPTSDPDLLRFNEILTQCWSTWYEIVNVVGEPQLSPSEYEPLRKCLNTLRDAAERYCENFETYDTAKCRYVNSPSIQEWRAEGRHVSTVSLSS